MSARFRRCFTIILLILGGVIAAPAAFAETTYTFNLPEQALADSLRAIGEQTEMNILFEPEAVKNARSPALRGQYTVDEAIRLVLAGTKLEAQHTAASNVVIKIKSVRSTTLPAISADTPGGYRTRLVQSTAGDPPSQPDAGPQNTDTSNSRSETSKKEGISEILVTAEKHQEYMQDVPIPVTVINAATLTDNSDLRLQDYYTQIPSLNLTQGIQSSQGLNLRGLSAGVLIDDVPISGVVPDLDPGSLARIETLRGPQGTLYGASGLGGLIKFVTLDPSTEAVSGRVEAGTNDVSHGYDLGYNVRGSINVPLTADLALRASAFWRQDAGYIDDPSREIDGINRDDANGGQLTALWRPSDTLSLRLSALYQDIKGGNNYVETVNGVTLVPLGEFQQSDVAGTGPFERKTAAYSAVLNAKVLGADLTSLTGYNVNTAADYFDVTSTVGPLAQFLFGVGGAPVFNYHKATNVTQEFRLAATVGQKFDWLVGAYYSHQANPFQQHLLATDPVTGAVAGELAEISFPSPYTEYAAFINLTYHFTDRFDVQVGGRESRLTQDFNETITGIATPFVSPTGSQSPYIQPTEHAQSHPFTYLFTPRFKIAPDWMVYARLASGFSPGGGNIPGPEVPSQYGPEKTNNYEIGTKADFLDRTVSFDASIYYIQFRDIQLGFINSTTDASYTANVGSAKSQGLELSVESRPASGLKLAAWVVFSEAVLTEIPPGVTLTGIIASAGDSLPDSSRFSGNVSVDQEFPLSGAITGFVGATESYLGQREGAYGNINGIYGTQRFVSPAYARTDVRAGAKYDSWAANLYINNATDRRGLISGDDQNAFANIRYIIQPRTIGLSIAKTF
jgi:iron complex outermembrane receptor protein